MSVNSLKERYSSDHFEALPKHHGRFLELNPSDLEKLAAREYQRLGVGIAILNKKGEILTARFRQNNKLGRRVDGPISETVTAVPYNGALHPEPVIHTIARCIKEELGIDPATLNFSTRLELPFNVSDWPASRRQPGRLTFGINVALLADDETAKRLINIEETPEVLWTRFIHPTELVKRDEKWEKGLRPGTNKFIESLDDVGLLNPLNLTEAQLELPSSAQIHDLLIDIDLLDYLA